jgi:hypothetical protein
MNFDDGQIVTEKKLVHNVELNQSVRSSRSLKSNRDDKSSIEGYLEKHNVSIQLLFLKMTDNEAVYQPNLDDSLISCNEIESISGCSYAYLIGESFKVNKGFIIARVKTRSNQDHTKKFYHYFYAANLIQLLVKPNINFLENILN